VAIEIRALTPEDSKVFSLLRLEALEQDPQAFGESAAEHRSTSPETRTARLQKSSTPENFVLGSFADGQLVGTIGFVRHEGHKRRHKAFIWGVYVTPAWRGRGVGRSLLSELVHRARLLSGLEQVTLTVNSRQTAAKRLYSSFGFEVFGHERQSLKIGDTYVDEDHMALHFH
jgi:RimJ/RimL family protein N-acetyltransferase